MRNLIFIAIIICGISHSSFAQIRSIDECTYLLEYYAPKFEVAEYDIYSYFFNYERVPDGTMDLWEYLDCLVALSNKGNKEAEKYFFSHMKDIYYATKEKDFSTAFYFDLLHLIRKLNPSEYAFEFSLLFFGDNRSYSDELKKRLKKKKVNLGHQPDTHFGMLCYRNILYPMMSKEQREFYKKELGSLFVEYIDKFGDINELESLYHPIWCKRIKEDWEAGKIKLRNSKN